MATGWIESTENYRCPNPDCDARLVQTGRIAPYPGGAKIYGQPFPVYCPAGCEMPASYSSEMLDEIRDSRGHQRHDASTREMPKPPRVP